MTFGTFYGVGVGPGDPELLTRKAERVLRAVDWIFCPAGADGRTGFAARILEPLALPIERFRPVALAMSRERAEDEQTYAHTAETILAELRAGHSAAWIAEGDPLFFSTFWHLYGHLRRQWPEARVEIVPGVCSLNAAAARAVVPLAQLDERLAVLPAAYGLEGLEDLLKQFTTVVLLKVHSVLDRLLDRLERFPEPVRMVCVEKVGTPEERVITDLKTMRNVRLSYFSLVILRREPS